MIVAIVELLELWQPCSFPTWIYKDEAAYF